MRIEATLDCWRSGEDGVARTLRVQSCAFASEVRLVLPGGRRIELSARDLMAAIRACQVATEVVSDED